LVLLTGVATLVLSARGAPVALAASATTVAAPAAAVDWGDLGTSAMVDVGDADPATSLTFYVGLTTDDAGLSAFARSVSDPASSAYGDHLGIAEVADHFGASAATEAAVVQYFAGQGIVASVDPTGVFATVSMTLATAEAIFGVDWRVFTPASGFFNGLDFLYPVTTPVLPAELQGAVSRVHGAVVQYSGSVTAVEEPEPVEAFPAAALTAGGGSAYRTGTASGCAAGTQLSGDGYYFGLTPNQLLEAYDRQPAVARLAGPGHASGDHR
jgi:subtilase family serine protease